MPMRSRPTSLASGGAGRGNYSRTLVAHADDGRYEYRGSLPN